MTTLRTAAQQALEALELTQTDVHWELNSPTRKFLRKAEKALRAALAEPVHPECAVKSWAELEQKYQAGCAHCRHPLYCGIKCGVCGRSS